MYDDAMVGSDASPLDSFLPCQNFLLSCLVPFVDIDPSALGRYDVFVGVEVQKECLIESSYTESYRIGREDVAVGGGSGTGRFTYVIPPLDAIKARGQEYGALVQYITSNYALSNGGLSSLAPSPPDVCILFLKSWATEGDDRTTLIAEWNSTTVVENVAATCNNTVVVLHGSSPSPGTQTSTQTQLLCRTH